MIEENHAKDKIKKQKFGSFNDNGASVQYYFFLFLFTTGKRKICKWCSCEKNWKTCQEMIRFRYYDPLHVFNSREWKKPMRERWGNGVSGSQRILHCLYFNTNLFLADVLHTVIYEKKKKISGYILIWKQQNMFLLTILISGRLYFFSLYSFHLFAVSWKQSELE